MRNKYKRKTKNKIYLHLKNFSAKLRKLPKSVSDIVLLDFLEMPDNCFISDSYLKIPFGRIKEIHFKASPNTLGKDEGISFLRLILRAKLLKGS